VVKYAAFVALMSVSILCITATYCMTTTLSKLDNEIDELHRLTLEAGLTAMEARKASVKESKYLDTWNSEITKTINNVNSTLLSSTASIASVSAASVSTLQATQETVSSLQAPILSANQALTAATGSINDLDTLIKNPAIPETIAHTDATMSHVDATTKDVQDEVYKYTHPGIWSRIKGFALDVAHVFNPL
jgi:hypothetical protein